MAFDFGSRFRACWPVTMPKFYHGPAWNRPKQLRELPFDLYRSHRYPRDPGLVAAAVETYGRPLPAVMFPQRMGFQRWKTSQPFQPAWGQDAQGVVIAVETGQATAAELGAYGVPPVFMSPEDFASQEGLNELPQPSATLDPDINSIPIARNYLPQGRMSLSSADLDEYGRREVSQRVNSRAAASVGRNRALAEVYAQQDAISALVTPDPRSLPWYMR